MALSNCQSDRPSVRPTRIVSGAYILILQSRNPKFVRNVSLKLFEVRIPSLVCVCIVG